MDGLLNMQHTPNAPSATGWWTSDIILFFNKGRRFNDDLSVKYSGETLKDKKATPWKAALLHTVFYNSLQYEHDTCAFGLVHYAGLHEVLWTV